MREESCIHLREIWGAIWALFNIWQRSYSLSKAGLGPVGLTFSWWCCGQRWHLIFSGMAALIHRCRKWGMCKFFIGPCDSDASSLYTSSSLALCLRGVRFAPSDVSSLSQCTEQRKGFFPGDETEAVVLLDAFPPHRGRSVIAVC